MKKGLLISIGLMLLSQHANAQTYFDVYELGHVNPSASIAASSIDSIGITGSTEQNRNVVFYKGDNSVNSHLASGIDSIKVRRPSNKLRIKVKGVYFNMVKVSGGTFQMGATAEQDSDAADNERPVHQVTLSDYYIGETEVTQELWQAVMGSNPSFSKTSNQLPVEQVSWNDCQTFINRLNVLTGKQFYLPTEAEWEFAARGGNKLNAIFNYSGDFEINFVAWYIGNSRGTQSVGSKAPNQLGIYDMSGNVWEWCQDWYGTYSSSTQTNPTGPSSGSNRVIRGGSWYVPAQGCRVSFRGSAPPTETRFDRGLRLALKVDVVQEDINLFLTANGASFNMVKVSGGTFQMGATAEQGSDADNEKPVHQVTLPDYYIGETEVTQELWQAVMGCNPSFSKTSNQLPVEQVSWNDCQTFITKLNLLTGKHFRLPTEAEWEFAARGGNLSQGYKYSGSNNIYEVAWHYDNSGSKTHEVGTKAPNELGIFDMSGNVLEWCQDWYGTYNSSAQTNPTGPSSGSNRVNRGGSWINYARLCQVSYRSYRTPSYKHFSIGLRLALADLPNNKN